MSMIVPASVLEGETIVAIFHTAHAVRILTADGGRFEIHAGNESSRRLNHSSSVMGIEGYVTKSVVTQQHVNGFRMYRLEIRYIEGDVPSDWFLDSKNARIYLTKEQEGIDYGIELSEVMKSLRRSKSHNNRVEVLYRLPVQLYAPVYRYVSSLPKKEIFNRNLEWFRDALGNFIECDPLFLKRSKKST